MLSKLFKHEIRATARTFMWLYIAFIIIVAVNALLGGWSLAAENSVTAGPGEFVSPNIAQGILAMLYVLAIPAMGVVTVVVIILRFFRNLLGDEGYLMMTLPVKREELVLSKLFAAMIWSLCTSVLIFLSILMLIASTGYIGEFVQGIEELIMMGAPLGRWIAMYILIMIISCAAGILMLYAAMAVGPNFLKNRVGGSILAFIIISVTSQIISAVVLLLLTGPPAGRRLFMTFTETAVAESADHGAENMITLMSSVVNTISLGAVISSVIIGLSCWFLTQYMLKKKLNLA